MNTGELEGLREQQLIQPPTIVTKQCSRSWLAWLGNDPIDTESGTTEAEAVGKIHMRYSGVFGIVQRQGE